MKSIREFKPKNMLSKVLVEQMYIEGMDIQELSLVSALPRKELNEIISMGAPPSMKTSAALANLLDISAKDVRRMALQAVC